MSFSEKIYLRLSVPLIYLIVAQAQLEPILGALLLSEGEVEICWWEIGKR
jgi:hypothetical protein